eukprot:GFUD01049341.1.p1 GENE.GFUD01049341.1~~GFUD01049341.1.p1  ORF type:complete len:406 (+),score=108.00 GFUD01049341.1:162-1220(+)
MYFDPLATENNTIPTVNIELGEDQPPVLLYAPDRRSDVFKSSGMRALDMVLSNMDNENWGVKAYDTVLRIVHEMHMNEIWTHAGEFYKELQKKPLPQDICSCITDDAIGLTDELEDMARKIRSGIPTDYKEEDKPYHVDYDLGKALQKAEPIEDKPYHVGYDLGKVVQEAKPIEDKPYHVGYDLGKTNQKTDVKSEDQKPYHIHYDVGKINLKKEVEPTEKKPYHVGHDLGKVVQEAKPIEDKPYHVGYDLGKTNQKTEVKSEDQKLYHIHYDVGKIDIKNEAEPIENKPYHVEYDLGKIYLSNEIEGDDIILPGKIQSASDWSLYKAKFMTMGDHTEYSQMLALYLHCALN